MKTVDIFQAATGEIEFCGDVEHETVWASLDQIAKLFNRDKSGISRHIKNIYNSEELEEKATVAKIATVQKEGSRDVTRDIEYYNLDMILSIGYRVDSKEATHFRKWATSILKTYTKTLSLLESYDKSSIEYFEGRETSYQLTYDETKDVLTSLKTELFTNEKAGE